MSHSSAASSAFRLLHSLVRPSSAKTLTKLDRERRRAGVKFNTAKEGNSKSPQEGNSIENRSATSLESFRVPLTLVDDEGNRAQCGVLDAVGVESWLEALPDSATRVAVLRRFLESANATTASPDSHALAEVCTRECLQDALAELERRQTALTTRLLAKYMADVPEEIEAAATSWASAAASKDCTSSSSAWAKEDSCQVLLYRSLVQRLTQTDHKVALALALGAGMPPLDSSTNMALARLVEVSSPTAVHQFLEALRQRDAEVAAPHTCATHLLERVWRTTDWARPAVEVAENVFNSRDPTAGDMANPVSAAQSPVTALVASFNDYNIDPAVVYRHDAHQIQKWAEPLLSGRASPAARADALLGTIHSRGLVPTRTCASALAAVCLSDLERPWLHAALPQQLRTPDTERARLLGQACLRFALKDPKRFLVAHRFLQHYAACLRREILSPHDPSFAAFIEECGECHTLEELPETLVFTLENTGVSDRKKGFTLREVLLQLAPKSSFWRTLLERCPERVRAHTLPSKDVRVAVDMRRAHESVTATQDALRCGTLPVVPTIYDDGGDGLFVLDKPAGVATTRHALCRTQLSQDVSESVTDLQSIVLLQRPQLKEVFRQGQVHRLDKETSGAIVFAHSNDAMDSLRHQMGTAGAFLQYNKLYLALCVVMEPDLHKIPRHGTLEDVADSKIRTRYHISRFSAARRIALVMCRIQQGTKHQIRRHLASAGLPILGDVEHGGAVCSQPSMSRVALHARSISVVHPRTGKVIKAVSPIPDDFQSLIDNIPW